MPTNIYATHMYNPLMKGSDFLQTEALLCEAYAW